MFVHYMRRNECCDKLKNMPSKDKKDAIQKAINHFEYGIKCDIFSEPVTTHARLAVEALKEKLKSIE